MGVMESWAWSLRSSFFLGRGMSGLRARMSAKEASRRRVSSSTCHARARQRPASSAEQRRAEARRGEERRERESQR
eukprot:3116689-Rhodomonas_salina.1